ncbi:MAG: cytochrome c, partial [Bacteroidota bacterium]
MGRILPIILLVVAGCHLDMYDQPKFRPMTTNTFYADSSAARPLPEGTVARGQAKTDGHLFTGRVDGAFTNLFPFPVTDSLL